MVTTYMYVVCKALYVCIVYRTIREVVAVSSSIRLSKETIERLKAIGRKGESYEAIVVWLLDHSKRRKA